MAERRTHGFWKGFLTGLLLAAAGAAALAWLYPPRPLLPPEVDAGALQAPAAPEPPRAGAEPAAPQVEELLTPARPLIADAPAPEAAPVAASPAGSPSLVPAAQP